jgi:hypothetical protein
MHNGKVVLPVRFALLYYFDKHLRVDLAPQLEADPQYDARKTPIVVANVTGYEAALRTVGVQRRPASQT